MRKAALLFVLVALAQWAVPLWTIVGKEKVLTNGTEFKFKLQPIDPTDPFRGEYVILNFANMEGSFDLPVPPNDRGEIHAFAVLKEDVDGFVRIDHLTLADPVGSDYIRVTGYVGTYDEQLAGVVGNVQPEFDRYYLEEGGGHVAEDLVRWRPDTLGPREAYALVRVYHGDAVIEDLIIQGRPVRDWITDDAQRMDASGTP